MEFRIEEFTPRDVAFTRRQGAYKQMAPVAWQALWAWLRDAGHADKVKRAIGIGWDDPVSTPLADRRYDACVELHEKVDGDPGYEISLQTLPGGLYAVHQLVGPYHRIGDTLQTMMNDALPEKGLAPDMTRPFLEIYINDPTEVAEHELRTDLCVPVEM